ncbi:MAG: serine O-acetyltransferase [Gammaproteobacteria bacterium]|uniref:serine O-acetyltransferase n=1 Tax=Pseudomaricurvus alcaniphilus TaxID=1166482 RepID=UPI001408352E|nr:serine O-acetyltransferase [Pseudomaricurvus alcaniphilus]MBR9909538.1 serine O-acetyltransferase [Gammaproteobacteria bacterium]NHN37047.1 serine O-acetyltransferase [Pseudomaricurvus alcaniphilus]
MSTLKPVINPDDDVWATILDEAEAASRAEPVLASYYHAAILKHRSFEAAISFHLANKLDSATVPAMTVRDVITEAMQAEPGIGIAMRADIRAYRDRDPACDRFIMPFLYFKGFHALQAQRVSHWLWRQQRKSLALYFQNQISQTFAVDIHPGAKIGSGIMIDHATGVVVGETAVIGDNVSMLHSVTLGGSGCSGGDRHPKVGSGVLISAGAKILGPITIGDGAKIGAGSVVLISVPAHTTAAGVPARIIGRAAGEAPALDMDHCLGET